MKEKETCEVISQTIPKKTICLLDNATVAHTLKMIY